MSGPHRVLPRSLISLVVRLYGVRNVNCVTACPTKNVSVRTQQAAPQTICVVSAAGKGDRAAVAGVWVGFVVDMTEPPCGRMSVSGRKRVLSRVRDAAPGVDGLRTTAGSSQRRVG